MSRPVRHTLASGARVLFACLALLAALVVGPTASSAQTLEQLPYDTQGNNCTSGFHFDRFEVTSAIYLDYAMVGLALPPGTPMLSAVYWSPTEAGPYTLLWSDPGPFTGGWAYVQPDINIDPGWMLIGVAPDTTGAILCRTSTTPAQMNTALSFGSLAEGGFDASITTSLPATYTPTLSGLSYGGEVMSDTPLFWPVVVTGGPYSVPETAASNIQIVTIDASASSDPDGTIVDWFIDCDDNSGAQQCNNTGMTCPCEYLNDDGQYTGFVRLTDNDGLVTQEPFSLEITNLPPVAAGSCDNGTCAGVEGGSLSFTCTGTDPGWNDVPALSWDLDGTVTYGPTFSQGLGDGNPFAASKTYADDGNYTAVCGAIDDDGGADQDTLSISIANADPVLAALGGPYSLSEGDTLSVTASATDLGVNDVLTYSWSWGDATTGGSGASDSHLYADDGTFTLSATVDDGDGGQDTQTTTVTVANVAPVMTGTCPTSAAEGTVAGFIVTASDPGTQDTLTWTLGGTSTASLSSSTGASNSVNWTPTYGDAQAATVTIDVTVDDGDSGTDALNCSVAVVYLDADADGMPDTWESLNGLDPSTNDAGSDPDGDGLTNLQEWQAGSDPQASGGPSAPTLDTPVAGVEVTSDTPGLVLNNATDPDGDTLVYDVEIYSDSTLSTLDQALTGVAEGSGGQTTATPSTALAENTSYWWRARADDGNTTSSWSTAEEFFVNVANDAPGLTTLSFPLASAIVSTLTPTLQWTEVTDADGDDLTYDVEVYEDAGLSTLTWSDTGISGLGNGSVEATTGALVENGWYWWRARSVDEHGLDGGWAAAEQFLVSLVDDAPDAPTIVWPADGGQVGDLAPVIEVADGADPEGFAVSYEIELALDMAFAGTVWTSGQLPEAGSTTSWDSADASAALTEDALGWVRARSVDNGGLTSGWTTHEFTTNSENNAPTVPTLIAPDGDAFGLTETITFRWANATDSDGTTRTYDVDVLDDIGVVAWSQTGVVEGDKESSVTALAGDLPYGVNTWTARSVDELGLTSEWAAELDFEVVPPKGDDDDDSGDDDDSTGDDDDATGDDDDATVGDDDDASGDDDDSTGGCDCESSVAGTASPGLWFLLGAAALSRRRRR